MTKPKEPANEQAPTVAELIRLLKDPQVSQRVKAAAELGELGLAARPAVPALQAALKDPDVNVRAVAQAALRKIEAAGKPKGEIRP